MQKSDFCHHIIFQWVSIWDKSINVLSDHVAKLSGIMICI